MSEFTNGNTQANNNAQTKTANPSTVFKMVNTQSLNQLINNANTSQILGDADKGLDTQVAPPCQVDCGTPPGHLQGYAAGVYTQSPPEHVGNSPVGVLANWNSTHVNFAFNPDANGTFYTDGGTFSALLELRVGMPGGPDQGGANITFGDLTSNPDPQYSFINGDGGGLLAFARAGGVTILHDARPLPRSSSLPLRRADQQRFLLRQRARANL